MLRAHSWVALVAFLCGWMLPLSEAHPLGQDDAACVVIAGSYGSSNATVAATPSNQDPPAHCVVCHLTRAMSGAVAADITTLAVPFINVARHQLLNDSPLIVTFAPPSSRGPPAAL